MSGSAKGRRSIADRPKGTYGRLRALRPGEYAILDTQDLDMLAMEPVTCRWVRTQLTIAQDLFTRGITGLRVTPVSTKAVDVAGILYQAITPQPAPDAWPAEACWAYHGVPRRLVFAEDGRLPGIPACPLGRLLRAFSRLTEAEPPGREVDLHALPVRLVRDTRAGRAHCPPASTARGSGSGLR